MSTKTEFDPANMTFNELFTTMRSEMRTGIARIELSFKVVLFGLTALTFLNLGLLAAVLFV